MSYKHTIDRIARHYGHAYNKYCIYSLYLSGTIFVSSSIIDAIEGTTRRSLPILETRNLTFLALPVANIIPTMILVPYVTHKIIFRTGEKISEEINYR
jgi:hypothetical protein